jgi:outer membrane protein
MGSILVPRSFSRTGSPCIGCRGASVFGILFVAVSAAHAVPISLDALYERARQHNESVAIQDAILEQRNELAWQAVAPMLPQVQASALLLKQTALPSGIASQFSPENQVTLKVGLTQSLFKGLRDFALISKTQSSKDAQAFRRDAVARVLYVDLAQAVGGFLQARGDVTLLAQEVGINRKRLQELRSFQSRGRNRQSELLALESTVSTQEGLLEQARGALRVAEEQVRFVLGERAGIQPPEPQDISLHTLPAFPPLPDALTDFSVAIENRPEVAAARKELDAAESQAALSRGYHLPTADVSANYYFDRPGLLTDIKWDISLSAGWVLFAGGSYQSQYKQSLSEMKAQELQLTRTRRQVDQEIRTLFSLAQSGAKQWAQLVRAMGFAEQAYAREQQNYRSGLATTVEVLSAQALWLSAQRNENRARIGQSIERIRYEVAIGGLPKNL